MILNNYEVKVINSLKAITLGVLTILILGVVNQLVLIMGAVAYNSLMQISPIFIPWSQVFTYALAGTGFFIVMAGGGLVTARAALERAYTKAVIASILGSSLSLYLSFQGESFTPVAFFFVLFGVISSLIGCWTWEKYQLRQSP